MSHPLWTFNAICQRIPSLRGQETYALVSAAVETIPPKTLVPAWNFSVTTPYPCIRAEIESAATSIRDMLSSSSPDPLDVAAAVSRLYDATRIQTPQSLFDLITKLDPNLVGPLSFVPHPSHQSCNLPAKLAHYADTILATHTARPFIYPTRTDNFNHATPISDIPLRAYVHSTSVSLHAVFDSSTPVGDVTSWADRQQWFTIHTPPRFSTYRPPTDPSADSVYHTFDLLAALKPVVSLVDLYTSEVPEYKRRSFLSYTPVRDGRIRAQFIQQLAIDHKATIPLTMSDEYLFRCLSSCPAQKKDAAQKYVLDVIVNVVNTSPLDTF
jgi:hypothetical protein